MRWFFGIFGALGLAISCVQGVEPFIEVVKWIAWASGRWVELGRAFWQALAGLVGIVLPRAVADGLSGVVYTLAMILCFRRINLPPDARFFRLVGWFSRTYDRTQAAVPFPVLRQVAMVGLAIMIYAPYVIVFILIYLKSPVQALALLLTSAALNMSSDILPGRASAWLSRTAFGERRQDDPLDADERFAAAYLLAPVVVLCLVLAILIVNEVALNADNLTALYRRARCEAGIACD